MRAHEYDGSYEFRGQLRPGPNLFLPYFATSPPWQREPTPERAMTLIRALGASGASTVTELEGVGRFFNEPAPHSQA